MKYIKFIFTLIFVNFISFSFSACSKSKNENDSKLFVGIAIYQKLENNLNWTKFKAKPNEINNIISTKNNKIEVYEEPELLFFVYNQNEITSTINDDSFISNTTKDKVKLDDNTLSFRIERISEDTEILIYFIYKLKTNDYYLEYKDLKTDLINEKEIFDLSITNNNFSKVELILETNLTIRNEY